MQIVYNDQIYSVIALDLASEKVLIIIDGEFTVVDLSDCSPVLAEQ